MKPAITFNGKPIKYESVTYSKDFDPEFYPELYGPLNTSEQQLADAEILRSDPGGLLAKPRKYKLMEMGEFIEAEKASDFTNLGSDEFQKG